MHLLAALRIRSPVQSTPEPLRFTAIDFNSYVTVSIAEGPSERQDGRMAASTAPGLGVRLRLEVLGRVGDRGGVGGAVALYAAATARDVPEAIFESIETHACNYGQREYSTILRTCASGRWA